MAEENEDGQEKTEEPSQRKLDKAAEEGRVLTSKEMMVFTTLAMGLVHPLPLRLCRKTLAVAPQRRRKTKIHHLKGLKGGIFDLEGCSTKSSIVSAKQILNKVFKA